MKNDITFHSSNIPTLKADKYTVKVHQEVTHQDTTEHIPFKSLEFYVDGPKFELEAGMVHHVYPVDGLHGDFVADVPSIVLNRITLPWEREKKSSASQEDSWLMLFMVNKEEMEELEEGNGEALKVLGTDIDERYQDSNVNYVKIPLTLKSLFPKSNEYKFLSYCRKKEGADEKSVLLCNRLPTPGSMNTVYLLSLEHSLKEDGKETYAYLHKWSFYCDDEVNYFIPSEHDGFPSSLVEKLFNTTTEFEMAIKTFNPKITSSELVALKVKYRLSSGGNFHDFLHHLKGKLSSFNYPIKSDNLFVKQGGLVLKEQGNYKWYRGPLQATPVTMNYFSPTDRTYQVAYELGRLTALKDDSFHKPYYAWKQEVSTALLVAKNSSPIRVRSSSLAFNQKININKPLPPLVLDKIKDWKVLKGIPYSYLIPSTKMLPKESIRTFCFDKNWINAFLLGALSIGNTYDIVESELYTIWDKKGLFQKEDQFGFLFHSLAVGGWPEFIVELNDDPKLTLEVRKLAKNIKFYLAPKAIAKLSFQLPPGKTHSGFRYENGSFFK